ncbi:hypothetical protein, partial [Oceaniglobus trochenteri]|uniref:hypothetical protein n=1 Tax=Oceaniglobus trochenteri TaxID=2763260 RepID=UPI00247A14C4
MISKEPSAPAPTSSSEMDFWTISPREILWRCNYLDDSGYLAHVPFLFWLVREGKPRQIVTLGLETGVAHFAFCQAIDRLGLATLIYGIAPERPDGENAIDERIERHNALNHADFSRLYTAPPAAAGDHFAPGSIDILLLDTGLSAATFEMIETTWADRLSDQGMIVLCGTDPAQLPEKARAGLRALHEKYDHIHFPHGSGLTLFLTGTVHTHRLKMFASQESGRSDHRTRQQIFQRLGMAHLHEYERQKSFDAESGTRKRIDALQADLLQARTATEALQERIDTVTDAYEKRSLVVTRLYARLFDLEAEAETRARDRDAAQEALRQLETVEAERKSDLEAMSHKLVMVRAERDAARIGLRDVEEREDENQKKSEQAHKNALKALTEERDKARAERDNAKQGREQAEQKHKAEAESLRAERDKARAERDSAKQGREQAEQKHKAEAESLRAERDKARAERDSAKQGREQAEQKHKA